MTAAFHRSPSLMDRRPGGLPTASDPAGDAALAVRSRDLRAENARLLRDLRNLKDLQGELVSRMDELTAENSRLLWLLDGARTREETLSRELEAARRIVQARASAPVRRVRGRTFVDLLRRRLEVRLGRTGPLLLDRVIGREGADVRTSDAASMLALVDRLLTVAPKLVSGHGGRALEADLLRLHRWLERKLPAASGPAPEVEAEADIEMCWVAPPRAQVVHPVEEAAVVPPPVLGDEPAPADPAPAEEAPAALVPVVEEEPVRDEATTVELPIPVPEAAPLVQEPAPAVEEGRLVPARDPELLQQLARARADLADGRAEESLDLLVRLDARYPSCLEVQAALFDLFLSFECWAEAHGVARRLSPEMQGAADRERFRGCMARVLEKRVESTRDPVEKKGYLLELAELHLDLPDTALAYLQRARLLPEKHEREGWIDLHLTRLGFGGPDERCRALFRWMNRMAEHEEVFAHLERIFAIPRFREQVPVARAILALVREGRAKAAEAERSRDFRRLLPAPGKPERFFAEYQDVRENMPVRRLLNELMDLSGEELPPPTAAERACLALSVPVSRGWAPARLAEELRHAMFGGPLEILRYEGPERFLARSVAGGTPTLLIHADLEKLSPEEARPVLMGALYRLRRRHADLARLAEGMDDRLRAALIQAARSSLLRAGGALPEELDRRVEALHGGFVPSTAALVDLADRCHRATRSDIFALLLRLLGEERPFGAELDRAADQFVALVCGPTAASLAVAREVLGDGALLDRCVRQGFGHLYGEPGTAALRLRLQRLWLGPLRAVVR